MVNRPLKIAFVIALLLPIGPGCDENSQSKERPDATVALDAQSADATSDSDVSPEEVLLTTSGPLTVHLRTEDNTISFRHDGAERLRLPVAALQIGTVDAVSDQVNYDPYYVFDDNPVTTPPSLTWHTPSLAEVHTGDATVRLDLEYSSVGAGQLLLTVSADARVTARFIPPEGQVAYVRLRPLANPMDAFYGLGEVFDDVNHRGKVRAMQIELDTQIESTNNEAHVPIPVIYGHTGWGLFVESLRPGVFAVTIDDDETIDIIFGTGVASDEGLQFHVFTEPHPLDLTRHYYELTGFPKLPAPWALGPWIWRDENDDEAQVRSDIDTIRELDLATSGYWIDRPYASAVNSFDWDPNKFDDPQGMIDRIHAMGFRFALWHTPYVGAEELDNENTESTRELRDVANAEGYFPPTSGFLTSKWGRLVDLTNPDAYAWWQGLIRRYSDMGVEGYKLDYAEDIVPGLYLQRSRWDFADGSNDQTMHARYQTLYHRVYAETLPETGGFMLCRSATWGGQTNGIIIWPGDLDANLAAHRDRVDGGGGSYVAVGGLRASVIAGLSLGPSGYPFYGSDTGGYRNAPPNKETFTRWFQQTALSSVMQVGTNTNNVAWEFSDRTGFDEEMLGWYRIFTRLHLRLFPYAWTYAQRIAETGRPIQRPYGLQYPELGKHPSDTYFFGDDLLVAPVLGEGERARVVPFPPGRWYDWWTGVAIEGGEDRQVEAPLSTLPLYLRAGGIIPLLRENIDTLSPATVDGIESFANETGRLHLRIAPGPNHQFTLYDGTRIAHETNEESMVITPTRGNVFTGEHQYEIVGLETTPSGVQIDGRVATSSAAMDAFNGVESGYYYDPDRRRLLVRTPGGLNVSIVF